MDQALKPYDKEAKSYYRDIREYLAKVRSGRRVAKLDPNEPQFDPVVEDVRQADYVDRANAYEKLMRKKQNATRR